jgi:YebC/PmpR family DNA-binding regulatory protein
MSGHSKWATIKRQKGANDAKKGAVFTKLGKQLVVAARSGTDPSTNPALAMVVEQAKAANMPLSNIERAIQRVADKNSAQLEEATYEGYGPGGIAVIIETATDNKNRTVAEVKSMLSKHGGRLAEAGAVSYLFDRKGIVRVKKTGDDDTDQLAIIDAGAEDVFDEELSWVVHTDPKMLMAITKTLQVADFSLESAELAYAPRMTVEISGEAAERAMKFMDVLDELDDVTNTYTNFDIKEE